MKRIISLLLIVIMSCSALVGCDWKNIFNKETSPEWEAPEGVVETTTTDKDGNPITIAHSDNFTQDDIEFVAMRHSKKMGPNFGVNDVASISLGEMIRNAQDGFFLYLMHIENPYIIVAYLKPNLPEYELDERNNYIFDSEKYLWYKFNTTDKIPNSIDDNKITIFSYLLYDCTITKDIGNNSECNYRCKYYLNYYRESDNIENSKKFLAYYMGREVCSTNNKFLSKPANVVENSKIYTDENEIEYLEIFGEKCYYDENGNLSVVSDYVKEKLWPYENDYYDVLSPHFTYFSHTDAKFENQGKEYIKRYVYIKMDDFIDVLFEQNEMDCEE